MTGAEVDEILKFGLMAQERWHASNEAAFYQWCATATGGYMMTQVYNGLVQVEMPSLESLSEEQKWELVTRAQSIWGTNDPSLLKKYSKILWSLKHLV